jgi:hypothetical protein
VTSAVVKRAQASEPKITRYTPNDSRPCSRVLVSAGTRSAGDLSLAESLLVNLVDNALRYIAAAQWATYRGVRACARRLR